MADADRPLPWLDESWQRALCIVAHPDDLEYGASAAVARWTSQGKQVAQVLVTRGEAGIDTLPPDEAGPLREREQRAGAAEVGVETVEFLDHRDGRVVGGLDLRRDLARAIRRHRPELVVGLTHRERFAGGGTNQSDHRVVGLAAVDASADAGNRWIFPELAEEGHQPWGGVRAVALAGAPDPTHAVDVSGHLPPAIRSLEAHAVYLEALGPGHPPPARFLDAIASAAGQRQGVEHAVLFEVFER